MCVFFVSHLYKCLPLESVESLETPPSSSYTLYIWKKELHAGHYLGLPPHAYICIYILSSTNT